MLNFNVDPYFDDFDPSKNYHRILFKPGRAVQARELTQTQTILQSQISNFAEHFFTQNTPIKGGNITINLQAASLKLNPTFNDTDVVASDFLNQIVTDDTGTVLAKVIATEEATGSDAPTLILTYYSGSGFANGANVISTTLTASAQAAAADAAGVASVASISNGVFYIVNGYNISSTQNEDGTFNRYSIGNFVEVLPQTIILEKYSNTPNARIGLEISEFISDSVTDPSLLDPAVGATNYQAPGADRYTIKLNLTSKTIASTGTNDSSFIELTRVESGRIVKQVNGTNYSAIDDYFAKRTYETNGDYVVNNFKVTASANTDPAGGDKYLLNIGPGIAYVQGYRTENQSQILLNGNRSRSTANINNNIITPSYGSYFFVNDLKGSNNQIIDVTTMQAVDFHVGGAANANTLNANSYNSTVAASGYVRSITYSSSGTNSNTQSYIYKAHVFGLTNKTLSTNVSSATADTIALFDNTSRFSMGSNVYSGVTVTVDSGVGAGQIRTVQSYNASTKTLTLTAPFSVIPTSSSRVSLRFGVKDIDAIVYAGAGTSSNLAIYGSAAINQQSKVNQLVTGDTILFDSDEPELIFPIGNQFVSTISDTSYTSLQSYRGQTFGVSGGGVQRVVTIDASATSVINFIRTGSSESADSIKQNFVVMVTDPGTNANLTSGDIVNFTNSPTRTVTVNAGKTTATFFANDLQPFTATIFAKVNVINGDNTNFVLKQKTLVEANTTALGISGASATIGNTLIDLTKGQIYINSNTAVASFGTPQRLFVSDVKRIVKIIDPKGTTPTLSMLTNNSFDVTQNYIFDNGQRDGFYGHATITLKAGAPRPQRLWILFDHYQTTGGDGYYSRESYTNEEYGEIPSYVASDGTLYRLRDCVDFRPSVKNLQTGFSFRYSVEPSSSNFYGTLIPQDTTNFTCDYSYYLARKDKLVLTKDSNFLIVEGTPSPNPTEPATPTNSLLIADITHEPYTSFVPGEAVGVIPSMSIVPQQNKNWQMKDISDMQERLNYIQYYSALNLLEQSAQSLQITDSFGLNRFKNGILVDDFSTYAVADTFNTDFSASINVKNNTLTAAVDVKNFQLFNQATLDSVNFGSLSEATQQSLGYKINRYGRTSVVTLQYTDAELVVQKLASRDTDVNAFSVRNTEGYMELTPPMDNWVDTETEPSLLFVDPTLKSYKAVNETNLLQVGDWQAIPGTQDTKVNTTVNGYVETTTSTTTEDYVRSLYYGNYTQTTSQKANYVTNVALLPYIRSQQIQFLAQNMLINTTVNAFFDGRRVSRLIRKPNIVEVTGSSATFKEGDTIGYLSSGNFIKTGKVINTYRASPTNIRLYVVDDSATTIYASGSLIAGTFNSSGNYVQPPTATGTVSSSTHFAGVLGGSGTSTNLVTLNSKASATNDFYVGMSFNIVGGSLTGISSVPRGLAYTITAYNGSTKVATLSENISYEVGDVYSIGGLQTDEIGNVSGIFYLFGGYFPAGDRTFRLDNRIVTQSATEFLYQKGTETTFAEAIFTAQGLTQKTQEIEFSPSLSAASKVKTVLDYDNDRIIASSGSTVDNTPRGGGCCVIATALEASGEWTPDRKQTLLEWCEKNLHDTILGECFRRGYQVMGSKLGVPLFRSKNPFAKAVSKYYTWSWNNGTNMALGKKFNPLTIPNSLFWITVFMTVGAVVSKEYADKTWKNLYK
jgi:hypothetical protein